MNIPTTARISRFAAFALGPVLLALCPKPAAAAAFSEADVVAFTDHYCSSCHNDVDKEGGLDLTTFKYAPADPANFTQWVKVYDRVQAGEMPPKEKKRPERGDLGAFLGGLGASLTATEQQAIAQNGRAMRRRMK